MKQIKKLIVLAMLCTITCACKEDAPEQVINEYRREESRRAIDLMSYIVYVKDSKTGLCFATFGTGSYAALMTNVPCTPEVEKVLVNR